MSEPDTPDPPDTSNDPSATRVEQVRALVRRGRLAEAEALCREARAAAPGDPAIVGLLCAVVSRGPDALDRLRDLAEEVPSHAGVATFAGLAARAAGLVDEAINRFRDAIAADPTHPDAPAHLAETLHQSGSLMDAAAAYEALLRDRPDWPEVLANLAEVHRQLGAPDKGIACCRRALTLRPDLANARNNLAACLSDMGDLEGALAAHREGLAREPGNREHATNLLYCLNYDPGTDAKALFEAYRRHAPALGRPSGPPLPSAGNDPDPDRRLRVGYVSPDFRWHACAYFIEPLLSAHDRAQVEVTCYADVVRPDDTTARLRALADRWRDCTALSMAALAERVRADGIDVLVDLAGHTARNRLPAFGQRPAPVQLSWLGYGHTTGLGCMDAVISDPVLCPPGTEAYFVEAVARLPRLAYAYRPPPYTPPVAPAPCLTKGGVVFGYFSRAVRLNHRVIACWARILQRVPRAALVLNNRAFLDPATRDRFARLFAEAGVPSGRLWMVNTAPHVETLAAYREVDIVLDPFPHNSATSIFEAVWMGVPVVSLRDRPPLGRFGDSILGAAGLGNLVADTPEDYVDRAVALASDHAALARIRAGLRDRVADSEIRDETGFARAMEAVYRGYWRRWCGQHDSEETSR